ncbi:MAG: MlaD family protein [Verrucomicrobia bacterium]|nr:MlaD family protein [Verrucomicrobiota bacterium]MDA1065407.1 MlaD family protein [Verrucomicrobiota bacterium]
MSTKPNATVVGIFVLGALAFAVVALIFLGRSAFSRASYRFVTYFDETVSGLEVGAAVKFRGVKIGQVTELKIFLGETEGEGVSSRIPVIYEVDKRNFDESMGSLIDISKPDELRNYIDDGLRARLATLSFITGLMYVELDIVNPDEYPAEYYSQFSEFFEIPTFKGTLAELSDNVTDFIKRFNSVDFEGISLKLIDLLENLNTEILNADLEGLSQSLQGTANSFTALAESPEFPKLFEKMELTLTEYQSLASEIRSAVDPTAEDLQNALQQLTKTLESLEVTTSSLHVMVRPQSSVRTNLDHALGSLTEAAESLRSLTDYLERNPSSLISGRPSSPD